MKIYTKTGDNGDTSLNGGRRVPKSSLRIDAYGTVDELNSHLGVVRSLHPNNEIDGILGQIQNALFVLGADLATPSDEFPKHLDRVSQQDVEKIEHWIDLYDGQLEILQEFILPAGSPLAARLHVARSICRRAERLVDKLQREESIRSLPLKYLNRLGDFLFVLARFANKKAKVKDVPWHA